MYVFRGDILIRLLAVSSCILFVACEQLPPFENHRETPIENAFVGEGRGGYDWVLAPKAGFEVARQSRFSYFDRIDPAVFSAAANIPLFEENEVGTKPDGMDQDVYHWLRRYTEPHESTAPLFSIPVSADVRSEGFDIDANGDRLLTIGEKIQVWDIEGERVLHSFPSPSRKIRAFLEDDGSSFTTVSSKSVDLISLPDGTTQTSWISPDEIESASVSRDQSVYCIITRDRRMFALDHQLELVGTYKGERLSNPFSAVHPDGKWILANTKSGPVRWHLDSADLRNEKLAAPQYDPQSSRCLSGTNNDRWMGHDFANVYRDGQWIGPAQDGSAEFAFQLNPRIVWAQDCTVDGSQSWSLILAEQVDVHDKRRVILQDLSLWEYSWSEPIFLEQIPIALAVNRSGERIALGNRDAVTVINRRRWVDPFGDWTSWKARILFAAGRLEQVDLFVAQVRQQTMLRYNISGESKYTQIIRGLGNDWSDMELNETDPDVLKKVEAWHAAGSELAAAASIARHIHSAWEARGGGFVDSVTRKGWSTFGEKMGIAKRELIDLLEQDQPPAYAFDALFETMKSSGARHLDAEQYLERFVSLYPLETSGHDTIAYWLLPKWGGDGGDSGAYFSKLADAYPVSYSDLVYARNVLNFQWRLTRKEAESCRFSLRRLCHGGQQMLELGYLTPRDAGSLMGYAYPNKELELYERIADYYRRQFTTLFAPHYNTIGNKSIYEARQRAFELHNIGDARMLPN